MLEYDNELDYSSSRENISFRDKINQVAETLIHVVRKVRNELICHLDNNPDDTIMCNFNITAFEESFFDLIKFTTPSMSIFSRNSLNDENSDDVLVVCCTLHRIIKSRCALLTKIYDGNFYLADFDLEDFRLLVKQIFHIRTYSSVTVDDENDDQMYTNNMGMHAPVQPFWSRTDYESEHIEDNDDQMYTNNMGMHAPVQPFWSRTDYESAHIEDNDLY